MNEEKLVPFTAALDEFTKELFNIVTEEAVVSTSDGEIYCSLFMVTFNEFEGEETAFISFNDAVGTSTLLKAADTLIPYIVDGLEINVIIDQCHYLKTNADGAVIDVLFEDGYTKNIKGNPKAK